MHPDVEMIPEALSLEKLTDRISKSKYNSFPVIDAKGQLTGILSFFDYRDALFDEDLKHLIIAKDLATSSVVTVTTEDDLYAALELISQKDFSIMPVVSPFDSSKVLGVLSRRDIIGAYNQAVMKKSLFKE